MTPDAHTGQRQGYPVDWRDCPVAGAPLIAVLRRAWVADDGPPHRVAVALNAWFQWAHLVEARYDDAVLDERYLRWVFAHAEQDEILTSLRACQLFYKWGYERKRLNLSRYPFAGPTDPAYDRLRSGTVVSPLSAQQWSEIQSQRQGGGIDPMAAAELLRRTLLGDDNARSHWWPGATWRDCVARVEPLDSGVETIVIPSAPRVNVVRGAGVRSLLQDVCVDAKIANQPVALPIKALMSRVALALAPLVGVASVAAGAMLISTVSSSASASAAETVAPDAQLRRFQRDTEGWYFYKDPKEPPKPPPPAVLPAPPPAPPAPPPAPPAPPPLRPMSVAWIAKYLPIVREAAIDDPTPENVRMHLYMQRIMLDKSELFTKASVLAANSDPTLNEDVRIPSASAFNTGATLRYSGAIYDTLKAQSGKAGVWVFVDSSCAFCRGAVGLAREFSARYNYPLKIVSLDGGGPSNVDPSELVMDRDRAAFRRFDLKLIPATVLALPPDKVTIIAHGAITARTQLDENAVRGLASFNLVDPKLMAVLNQRERGLLTTADFAGVERSLKDDAEKAQRAGAEGERIPPIEFTPQQVARHVAKVLDRQLLIGTNDTPSATDPARPTKGTTP